METKVVTYAIMCPHCEEHIFIQEKKWGEDSPQCPFCKKHILSWLEDGEYNVNFRVAGGTGAMKQGRKRFGGHR